MKDGAKNQKHKVAVDALSNVAKCAIVLRDAETAEGAELEDAAKDVWAVVVDSGLPCDVRTKTLEVAGVIASCIVAVRERLKERRAREETRKENERNEKREARRRVVNKIVSVVLGAATCVILAVHKQGLYAVVALAFTLRALGDSLPLKVWLARNARVKKDEKSR